MGAYFIFARHDGPWTPAPFVVLAACVVLGGLVASYISLFTENFVVPIMYKDNLPVLQAWKKFFALLRRHAGHFCLYGLFVGFCLSCSASRS